MNTESINEMTEWFMGEYILMVNSEKNNFVELELPIASIDGVRLENIVVKLFQHSMDLIMVLRNCEYSDNISWFCCNRFINLLHSDIRQVDFDKRKEMCFTKDTINEAVKQLFKSIDNLRYNNFEGHFTEKSVKSLPFKSMSRLASLGKASVGKTFSECCVCYETTKTHLSKCNHVVCGRCVSNMKQPLKCPMCRVPISTDAEESEEEE